VIKFLLMKFFITLIALTAFLNCFSQYQERNDNINWSNKIPEGWFQKTPNDSIHPVRLDFLNLVPMAEFSQRLSNGDKVYLLPMDNMPCIIPDSSRYTHNMPIAKGKIIGTIPNGSQQQQIIPGN
jgi:hypothetical protein